MSAKSKKRLCKLENKLQNLEKLELEDLICSICQSILIEPVTLPCFHYFCQRCFNGSIENNALCCPLCRLRIGSWLRTATKQNNLINVDLWKFIQSKFSQEIDNKFAGNDIDIPEDIPIPRLSAPGEIRSEYEAELRRLRSERLQQEQKHVEETQLLIKKIQQEEQEAQKEYLERLKQDELLAKEIQNQEGKPTNQAGRKRRKSLRQTIVRPKLKATKINGYLAKIQAPVAAPLESPLLTDDNTSTGSSTPKSFNANGTETESNTKTLKTDTGSSSSKSEITSIDSCSTNECSPKSSLFYTKATAAAKYNSKLSPEVVPRNGKLIKNLIDKKFKDSSTFWNKENGEKEEKEEKEENNPPPSPSSELDSATDDIKEKKKAVIKSLLVSLPLPNSGVLHHKTNLPVKKATDTDSVDSMRQELCFFKPIEKTSPTSLKSSRKLPIRVPSVRAHCPPPPPPPPTPPFEPSRALYLDSLCRLRILSLNNNLPSAFVIAHNSLKIMKTPYSNVNTRQATKRSRTNILTIPIKKAANNKKTLRVPNNTRINSKTNLRRTRSMGSIVKDENETTPKKIRTEKGKAVSDRKPHLRSDSKKLNANKQELESPPLISKTTNNSKVNLAVKNLSSPLKNCDVKQILEEQLRIEKMIEQEKKDLEFARQMDAEWNSRRQLRSAPAKRQVTINYALRPAKKLKA